MLQCQLGAGRHESATCSAPAVTGSSMPKLVIARCSLVRSRMLEPEPPEQAVEVAEW